MNLRESISVRCTPAPKKLRKQPGYWNWPELVALANKAMETGEKQTIKFGGHYYAEATPEYGIIESSRTPEYCSMHEKIRITLYTTFFTLHAEKGDMEPCPFIKEPNE